MNRVILMGRLTKDVELRYTNGSPAMAIGRYTIAVDRPKKKNGEDGGADFINCLVFDKGAEFADKYFSKGQKVLVEGRWQSGSYKDKNGNTVYTNECLVSSQEFAESKKSEDKPKEEPKDVTNEGFMNIPDDVSDEGLPFN